jgi:hypothetical protein
MCLLVGLLFPQERLEDSREAAEESSEDERKTATWQVLGETEKPSDKNNNDESECSGYDDAFLKRVLGFFSFSANLLHLTPLFESDCEYFR